MKITEIDWTDGRQYSVAGSNDVWTVEDGELLCIVDNYVECNILDCFSMQELVQADFTIVFSAKIDEHVEYSFEGNYWYPAHFAGTHNGQHYIFKNGRSSITTTEVVQVSHIRKPKR